MKKKLTLTLFISAVLYTLVVYTLQAQSGSSHASRIIPTQGGFVIWEGVEYHIASADAKAGPPAPVPPQVAILRPTEEEAKKFNAELQQLIETNTSSSKALLKKYASLATIQVPPANPATAPVQTIARSNQRHHGFVEIAKS